MVTVDPDVDVVNFGTGRLRFTKARVALCVREGKKIERKKKPKKKTRDCVKKVLRSQIQA